MDPLRRAVEICAAGGKASEGRAELARRIGVSTSAVAQWWESSRAPIDRAYQIEAATMGQVEAIEILRAYAKPADKVLIPAKR